MIGPGRRPSRLPRLKRPGSRLRVTDVSHSLPSLVLLRILCVASIRRSSRLLQPEMVLAGEHVLVLGLVAVPAVELALARKLALDLVLAARVDHEANECKPVVVQEGLDLWDGQAVLLHMEAQVAAAAHVVEVRPRSRPISLCSASVTSCSLKGAVSSGVERQLRSAISLCPENASTGEVTLPGARSQC